MRNFNIFIIKDLILNEILYLILEVFNLNIIYYDYNMVNNIIIQKYFILLL